MHRSRWTHRNRAHHNSLGIKRSALPTRERADVLKRHERTLEENDQDEDSEAAGYVLGDTRVHPRGPGLVLPGARRASSQSGKHDAATELPNLLKFKYKEVWWSSHSTSFLARRPARLKLGSAEAQG